MSFLKINLNLLKILYRVDHEHTVFCMGGNPDDFNYNDIPQNEHVCI